MALEVLNRQLDLDLAIKLLASVMVLPSHLEVSLEIHSHQLARVEHHNSEVLAADQQNLHQQQVVEAYLEIAVLQPAAACSEVLELVFKGSGECAVVQWVFLGLTIPGWTLVIFAALTIFGLGLMVTRVGARSSP